MANPTAANTNITVQLPWENTTREYSYMQLTAEARRLAAVGKLQRLADRDVDSDITIQGTHGDLCIISPKGSDRYKVSEGITAKSIPAPIADLLSLQWSKIARVVKAVSRAIEADCGIDSKPCTVQSAETRVRQTEHKLTQAQEALLVAQSAGKATRAIESRIARARAKLIEARKVLESREAIHESKAAEARDEFDAKYGEAVEAVRSEPDITKWVQLWDELAG